MTIPSLSGSAISSTYNRLVQTDGTVFADGTGSILTALNITSSTAISASYAATASQAATASYLENAIPPFPYTGSAVITGSLNIIGPFTASSSLITGNVVVLGTASINTLIVNQRQLSTGSNQLGDAPDDTQTLFGSVIIPTGSLTVTGSTFLSGPVFVEDIKPTSNIISIGNDGTDYLFLGVKNPNNVYPFNQFYPFPGIGIYSSDTISSSTRGSVVVSYNSGSASIGNFQVWSVDDDGNRTERLVVSNAGNLGIGTTNPIFKLDVQGTGRFTDNLTVTGSLNVNGGITGSFSGSGIITSASFASTASYVNPLTQSVIISGSARITNGLIVTGSSAFNQNITVNDLIFGSNNTQGQNIVIGKTGTNSLTSITTGFGNVALGRFTATSLIGGDNNIFIGDDAGQGAINSDGNVIIGRAAGQQNISGTTRNNYGNVFIGDATARNSMDTDENVAIGAGALQSARGIFSRGNTTVGTYTLDSVISSSYNVAVGYESGRDVVSGSFNILIGNQQKGFRTGSFNTVIGSYISPDTFTGNVTKSVILADGSGSIRLYSPSSTNILIGTITDTGEKLQVQGNAFVSGSLTVIHGSSGISKFVGDSTLYQNINGAAGTGYSIELGTNSLTPRIDFVVNNVYTGQFSAAGNDITFKNNLNNSGQISFNTRTSNSELTRIRIFNNGNVGIGTTTDTGEKLQVSGSAKITNGLTVTGSAIISGSDATQFRVGTSHLFVSSSGNVGIGNTNPNVPLDVSGVIAIRGGEAASQARMHFRASDNSNRFTIETDLDPNPQIDLLGFRGINTSNILVLKGNGDIGMGTTSPTKNLTINKTNATVEIRAASENENAFLYFGTPFANVGPAKAAIIAAGVNSWSRSRLHFCLEDTANNGAGAEVTLTNSRMVVTKEGAVAVGLGLVDPTARLQVRGSGATSATTTFLLQNSTPTTLTSVLDNGQALFTGPSTTLANGVAQFNISQSLVQSAVTNSIIDAVRISPTLQTTATNQVQTALKVQATFTGSFTGSQNVIADFGATSVGSQLTVTDITSGSIYMVNDVSGLPIIEATSDWSVRMYNFPQTVFEKTGSNVNIYGTLNATGSFILPLSQSVTPITGSAYWSGSLLFVYDGTRYRSSSFA